MRIGQDELAGPLRSWDGGRRRWIVEGVGHEVTRVYRGAGSSAPGRPERGNQAVGPFAAVAAFAWALAARLPAW